MHEEKLHDCDRHAYTRQFEGLIEDGLRVQFRASFSISVQDPMISESSLMDGKHHENSEAFAELIAFRYLDFKKRFKDRYTATQSALLLGYTGDAQLTNLSFDLERGTLAFDWKAFLNDFFQITTYVRARKQTREIPIDLAEESFDELWFRKILYDDPQSNTDWSSEFGKEDDECYVEGYFHRLRSAYNQAGLDFDFNNMVKRADERSVREEVAQRTDLCRFLRNASLIRHFGGEDVSSKVYP
jgi:hypothetical protein